MGQSSCSCFVPWDLSKYIVVGELERCFLNLLISGAFVPNRIWDALKQQYPKFNQWMTHRTAVVQCVDVSNSPVALRIALTPFTGLCSKRTGVVAHRQSPLLPRGPLF